MNDSNVMQIFIGNAGLISRDTAVVTVKENYDY